MKSKIWLYFIIIIIIIGILIIIDTRSKPPATEIEQPKSSEEKKTTVVPEEATPLSEDKIWTEINTGINEGTPLEDLEIELNKLDLSGSDPDLNIENELPD